MENNIFLCKSEISELLQLLDRRSVTLEINLMDFTLPDKERVRLQCQFDMFKSISSKLKKAL